MVEIDAEELNALCHLAAQARAQPTQPTVVITRSFESFSDRVDPLIPERKRDDPRYVPDAATWLVNMHRNLKLAECPDEWLVAHAVRNLPDTKQPQYWQMCADENRPEKDWTSFQHFVLTTFCKSVNKIDAFFRLLHLPQASDAASLDETERRVVQYGKAAGVCDTTVALSFLTKLPDAVQERVVMESGDDKIDIKLMRTIAAIYFQRQASRMDIDAIAAGQPGAANVDAVQSGFVRNAPAFALVRNCVSYDEYKRRLGANLCVSCGQADHRLRDCPSPGNARRD
ncbi:hypothetical protein H4R19_002890 [Coemansia spiralis]|nr:hypothetical protein H4R19_002890 [Coemansia spiralis]